MVFQIKGSSLLTTSEAADLLSAHINTVRRWSAQGKLTVYRIGPRGDRRYRTEDLRRFLVEQYDRVSPYTVYPHPSKNKVHHRQHKVKGELYGTTNIVQENL